MNSQELSDQLNSSIHEGEIIHATIQLQQDPPEDPNERKKCRNILRRQASRTTSEHTEGTLQQAIKALT